MTTKHTMLSVVTLLIIGLLVAACGNEENPNTTVPVTRLTATLNGASEKPASTTSTATGTFTGDLNTSTRVLSYTVTYQGITPTMGHLHKITKADGTGGVDVPFTGTLSSPYVNTVTLAQTKIDSMLAGFYYANLHTVAYPAGEIRGDIRKQ